MTNITHTSGSISSTRSSRPRRVRLGAFGVAGLVSLGLLLGAAPAEAGHGHGNGHGHGRKSHRHHRHEEFRRSHRPVFVVPSHIPVRRAVEFQPYFAARTWYRPHGHRHVVYRFPVYTDYGVVYHPYTYCGDHLFRSDGDVHGRIAFGGPHLGVHIGF